jgi:hypothetical protein
MSLPSHFVRWCYDLKQLAFEHGASITLPPAPEGAHDALVDARWNRDTYVALKRAEAKARRASAGGEG